MLQSGGKKKKKSPQEKNVQCVGSVGWRHKARESECMCGWEHERTAATVPGVRSTKNCNDFFTELLQMEEAETKRTMFLTISEKMKIYFGWKKSIQIQHIWKPRITEEAKLVCLFFFYHIALVLQVSNYTKNIWLNTAKDLVCKCSPTVEIKYNRASYFKALNLLRMSLKVQNTYNKNELFEMKPPPLSVSTWLIITKPEIKLTSYILSYSY